MSRRPGQERTGGLKEWCQLEPPDRPPRRRATEAIGGVRVCQHHADLAREIARDAEAKR